jgi:cell wall assembly regulator SMI1
MQDLVERVKQRWISQGVKPRHGATEQQINAFESRHDLRLPADLQQYFALVDGMEDGDMDDDLFSFLPLDHVKATTEGLVKFCGIPEWH